MKNEKRFCYYSKKFKLSNFYVSTRVNWQFSEWGDLNIKYYVIQIRRQAEKIPWLSRFVGLNVLVGTQFIIRCEKNQNKNWKLGIPKFGKTLLNGLINFKFSFSYTVMFLLR